MDREASVSSDPSSVRRHRPPVLPPWEVRSLAQVPFVEPGSPPIVRRDEQGFFTVPPSHSNSNHRPKLSTSTSAPGGASEYTSPASEHSNSNPWRSDAPIKSTTVTTRPVYEMQPYERPAYEDQTHYPTPSRKASSQPPSKYIPPAPPTPPDSITKDSLRSASASPPIRPESKALPGTMSSRAVRNRSASHNRAKSLGRDNRTTRPQSKQDQTGLGKRFKSAFRDMFKKDPVDESQLERISDRHWTDEY